MVEWEIMMENNVQKEIFKDKYQKFQIRQVKIIEREREREKERVKKFPTTTTTANEEEKVKK